MNLANLEYGILFPAFLAGILVLITHVPLEPRPGVPPSSGYLAQVLGRLQQTPARFVIRAAYEDSRPSEFISQRAHIPAIMLPFTVGGTPQATNLFTLYDDTITKLLSGIGQ